MKQHTKFIKLCKDLDAGLNEIADEDLTQLQLTLLVIAVTELEAVFNGIHNILCMSEEVNVTSH